MAIDGDWKIKVESPMGTQEGTLSLKTEGAKLSGTQKGSTGTQEIKDGKVEGNKLTWSGELKQPFPMKLEFTVTVNGNSMAGEVKAGSFGSSPLTGQKVA